jgi:hypothetical protein
MSREEMIASLKERGYTNIKVKGGTVLLEQAPSGNIFYMYRRVTGILKSKNLVRKESV